MFSTYCDHFHYFINKQIQRAKLSNVLRYQNEKVQLRQLLIRKKEALTQAM